MALPQVLEALRPEYRYISILNDRIKALPREAALTVYHQACLKLRNSRLTESSLGFLLSSILEMKIWQKYLADGTHGRR